MLLIYLFVSISAGKAWLLELLGPLSKIPCPPLYLKSRLHANSGDWIVSRQLCQLQYLCDAKQDTAEKATPCWTTSTWRYQHPLPEQKVNLII